MFDNTVSGCLWIRASGKTRRFFSGLLAAASRCLDLAPKHEAGDCVHIHVGATDIDLDRGVQARLLEEGHGVKRGGLASLEFYSLYPLRLSMAQKRRRA